jgi:hypothetical protein
MRRAKIMILKTIYPVMKGKAVSLTALFSNIILSTCLLKESSVSS